MATASAGGSASSDAKSVRGDLHQLAQKFEEEKNVQLALASSPITAVLLEGYEDAAASSEGPTIVEITETSVLLSNGNANDTTVLLRPEDSMGFFALKSTNRFNVSRTPHGAQPAHANRGTPAQLPAQLPANAASPSQEPLLAPPQVPDQPPSKVFERKSSVLHNKLQRAFTFVAEDGTAKNENEADSRGITKLGLHGWLHFKANSWARDYAPSMTAYCGVMAVLVLQVVMYLLTFLLVVEGSKTDGICPQPVAAAGLERSHWAKGSWFTGLILAVGRRIFWGSSADGVALLVDQFAGYASALSLLASLQVLDVLGAFGEGEKLCDIFTGSSELVQLAWAALAILGWSAAWDNVLKRSEGREEEVTVIGLLNPVGGLHWLCSSFLTMSSVSGPPKATKTVNLRTHRVSTLAVLAAFLLFSFLLGFGGLGGLSSAVLLAGLAGLFKSLAIDRLLWVIWWLVLGFWFNDRVRTALRADGFRDAEDAGIWLVIVVYVTGRELLAERLLDNYPVLKWVEPLGRVIASLKEFGHTTLPEVAVDPLFAAIQSGDVKRVLAILERQSKVDSGPGMWTPLHEAVNQRGSNFHHRVVARLLQLDAKVSATDDEQRTALHIAAECRHRGAARLLLNKKANPDARDLFGRTPLHYAARVGTVGVTKALLDHGADINIKDDNGLRAIDVACQNRHVEVVKNLLRELELQGDSEQLSSLHIAVKRGQVEATRLLIECKATVITQDHKGRSCLHLACATGSGTMVDLMLDHFALLEHADADGRTSLHVLAERGDVGGLSSFVTHKQTLDMPDSTAPLVNIQDKRQRTALHLAAQNGQARMVQSLLQAKANPTPVDGDKDTPLHRAVDGFHRVRSWLQHCVDLTRAQSKHKRGGLEEKAQDDADSQQTVQDLQQLVEGAPFTAKDIGRLTGNTPSEKILHGINGVLVDAKSRFPVGLQPEQLLSVASSRYGDVVNALIAGKADVFALNATTFSALHVAVMLGEVDMINHLWPHFAPTYQSFPAADTKAGDDTKAHDDDVTRMADSFGSHYGIRELAAAAGHSKDTYTSLLTQMAQAHPTAPLSADDTSRTLTTACNLGHIRLVRLLLSGASDNSLDKTAILAATSDIAASGDVSLLQMLLERQARLNDSGDRSNSWKSVQAEHWLPLHAASSKGHLAAVKLLLQFKADPLQDDEAGLTALHCAAAMGHVDVAQTLIEAKADVDQVDELEWPPIQWARSCGQDKMIKLLRDKQAKDLDKTQQWVASPLLHAAKQHHFAVSMVLETKTVSVNEQDSLFQKGGTENTALHEAAKTGALDVARVLVDAGASVNVTNSENLTPAALAAKVLNEKGDNATSGLRETAAFLAVTSRTLGGLHS